MFMPENNSSAGSSSLLQARVNNGMVAFIAVQKQMQAHDQRLRDFESDARFGQGRRELPIVISTDQTQPRTFADGESQPAQLRMQRGNVHRAMHHVAEQNDFAGRVAIEQGEQTLGGILRRLQGQELPLGAMRHSKRRSKSA